MIRRLILWFMNLPKPDTRIQARLADNVVPVCRPGEVRIVTHTGVPGVPLGPLGSIAAMDDDWLPVYSTEPIVPLDRRTQDALIGERWRVRAALRQGRN